ncbi:hypothetical protein XENOCAPTIV_025568, partial [Xenoophorus captivus]
MVAHADDIWNPEAEILDSSLMVGLNSLQFKITMRVKAPPFLQPVLEMTDHL